MLFEHPEKNIASGFTSRDPARHGISHFCLMYFFRFSSNMQPHSLSQTPVLWISLSLSSSQVLSLPVAQ